MKKFILEQEFDTMEKIIQWTDVSTEDVREGQRVEVKFGKETPWEMAEMATVKRKEKFKVVVKVDHIAEELSVLSDYVRPCKLQGICKRVGMKDDEIKKFEEHVKQIKFEEHERYLHTWTKVDLRNNTDNPDPRICSQRRPLSVTTKFRLKEKKPGSSQKPGSSKQPGCSRWSPSNYCFPSKETQEPPPLALAFKHALHRSIKIVNFDNIEILHTIPRTPGPSSWYQRCLVAVGAGCAVKKPEEYEYEVKIGLSEDRRPKNQITGRDGEAPQIAGMDESEGGEDSDAMHRTLELRKLKSITQLLTHAVRRLRPTASPAPVLLNLLDLPICATCLTWLTCTRESCVCFTCRRVPPGCPLIPVTIFSNDANSTYS